ncbi:MAG: DNA methylase [Oscillospiraceae bacterium]|nr:DNA methylase [Oscillospiraceae bacterium]
MRQYIAIDMKSFYASVECVRRGLDPLTADLLVADESRSDQTICLAVSPSLKSKGVPSRPRLFEAKQAIKAYEGRTGEKVSYITAVPRMAEYERVSARIYSILLRYVASDDVHVYSIDESFIDCTDYLHMYPSDGVQSPAHIMAMTIIRDVLRSTGITATVGIGTNLYLAKVAMDIVAKKSPPDKDGVRIAELDEDSYKLLLWEHRPLTDFWQIGRGKARRLEANYMFTMGDVAERSLYDEEWFYRTFGVDAEILIDHAWGIETVTMADIKGYHTDSRSMSGGQVLPRPYRYDEARIVFAEMADKICCDLYDKDMATKKLSWYVGYDYKSLDAVPEYTGPLAVDFYGRVHPKHSNGTVRLMERTNLPREIVPALLRSFDAAADHRLLFRRLNITAEDISEDDGAVQFCMFTDRDRESRDRELQNAMQNVRARFGKNAVVKGLSFLDGATAIGRNAQIGGHRA